MLLLTLPDLSQSDSEFNHWFSSRWGRENCIVWGRARFSAFGPCTHTLSIRAAWGGAEHCHFNGRTVAVDDDNFLILNHGRIYSTASAASSRSRRSRSVSTPRSSSGSRRTPGQVRAAAVAIGVGQGAPAHPAPAPFAHPCAAASA